MDNLIVISLALAGIPAVIGLVNLFLVTAPQGRVPDKALVSILIPARNAEADIEACIAHALGQIGVATEVIVLDDFSLDHTAELLAALAAKEPRFRRLAGSPPPPGWTRHAHACARLAEAARGTHLLFLDAGVRLDPHAAAALAGQAARMAAGLVSGVPRQGIRSLGAALTVPMRGLLLAATLPGGGRAVSRLAVLAAASGQLLLVTRTAYDRIGGHAAVRGAARDALALARRMRAEGIRTDSVDATALATSRQAQPFRDAWAGLTGRVGEHAAPSPGPGIPGTLLAAVHLLPLALLPAPRAVLALSLLAALRVAVTAKAREPWWTIALHPVALLMLLASQGAVLARATLDLAAARKARPRPLAGTAGP